MGGTDLAELVKTVWGLGDLGPSLGYIFWGV